MREDLSVLDELNSPDDWGVIQQRSPGRPPAEPRNTGRRIAAAATAIVVAVAAGTLLFTRFDRSTPLSETPTPTPGYPIGESALLRGDTGFTSGGVRVPMPELGYTEVEPDAPPIRVGSAASS